MAASSHSGVSARRRSGRSSSSTSQRYDDNAIREVRAYAHDRRRRDGLRDRAAAEFDRFPEDRIPATMAAGAVCSAGCTPLMGEVLIYTIAIRAVLIVAGLMPLAVSVPCSADTEPPATLSANALKHRGEDLRRDLVAQYKDLRAAGAIQRKNAPDVTTTVLKYIPIGISFNDAETILRAAGSKMKGNTMPATGGYIFMSIPLPAPLLSFGVGYFCAVNLVPRMPGDFSVVGAIKASIAVA